MLVLGLGVTTAYALDPHAKSPDSVEMPNIGVGIRPQAPFADGGPNDLTAWWHMMEIGNTEAGVKAADEAFHRGDLVAGWTLGRMYADGDRVAKDPVRAFHYFYKVASDPHGLETSGKKAYAVANAHVWLGLYYLTGIPKSDVKSNPVRAYQNFYYAAYNFSDADAQYHLGLAYLEGEGVARDPQRGANWIIEAAKKGQYEAQVKFGSFLVQGVVLPRDVAKGLFWLRVAVDTAPDGVAKDRVRDIYNAAYRQATNDERAAAEVYYVKDQVHAQRHP